MKLPLKLTYGSLQNTCLPQVHAIIPLLSAFPPSNPLT